MVTVKYSNHSPPTPSLLPLPPKTRGGLTTAVKKSKTNIHRAWSCRKPGGKEGMEIWKKYGATETAGNKREQIKFGPDPPNTGGVWRNWREGKNNNKATAESSPGDQKNIHKASSCFRPGCKEGTEIWKKHRTTNTTETKREKIKFGPDPPKTR